ncbi:hypothetical protein QCA50_008223 [Cerrena zonata]|uniref:Uncharacterized protein n=1 Tax=Cerrena zonata TaxID=2478898 RepID=A0AAW0GC02_9APHY
MSLFASHVAKKDIAFDLTAFRKGPRTSPSLRHRTKLWCPPHLCRFATHICISREIDIHCAARNLAGESVQGFV